LLGVGLAACRESDDPFQPGENARVEVSSDPQGALIYLDDQNTGKVTPDLLVDLIGRHNILVRLDRDNVPYGFQILQFEVKADSLHRILGPLTMRCQFSGTACTTKYQKYHTLGSMRVSTNPNGALFYYDGSEKGLYWPTNVPNGYASIGSPLISMVAGTRDTLALGIYDVGYLAGRPAPQVTQTAERYTMSQATWVVPPTSVILSLGPTVRGIEVEEELIGVSATNDVAFVKLTYRNITNRASYQTIDPIVPSAGITYNWVYVGFGLDADIGASNDDIVTYDAASDMVYMYDMDFSDAVLASGTPALVGLRLVQAPTGATTKVLNAWPAASDWLAGSVGASDRTERNGWYILSGSRSVPPDIAGAQIGHAPTTQGDYRMSVSAGPLTLAPGDAVSLTVAIIIAPPVAGTYNAGQNVNPDNPTTTNRTIDQVAAGLVNKAKALVVPQ
jgi:hypothetical protein